VASSPDPTGARPAVPLNRTSAAQESSLFNQMVDDPGGASVGSSSTAGLNKKPKEPPVVDDQLSRVFAALSDPTRRDIVTRLAVGDATVGELAAPYDVSVQAVSKHIKVLTDAGLVSQRKDAQRRPCHLEAEVFDLMTKWIERYRQRAQQRYERLDAVLAEMRDDEAPTHPRLPQQGAAS
jgi:DNA-binding transcriptional ArsR family regulator